MRLSCHEDDGKSSAKSTMVTTKVSVMDLLNPSVERVAVVAAAAAAAAATLANGDKVEERKSTLEKKEQSCPSHCQYYDNDKDNDNDNYGIIDSGSFKEGVEIGNIRHKSVKCSLGKSNIYQNCFEERTGSAERGQCRSGGGCSGASSRWKISVSPSYARQFVEEVVREIGKAINFSYIKRIHGGELDAAISLLAIRRYGQNVERVRQFFRIYHACVSGVEHRGDFIPHCMDKLKERKRRKRRQKYFHESTTTTTTTAALVNDATTLPICRHHHRCHRRHRRYCCEPEYGNFTSQPFVQASPSNWFYTSDHSVHFNASMSIMDQRTSESSLSLSVTADSNTNSLPLPPLEADVDVTSDMDDPINCSSSDYHIHDSDGLESCVLRLRRFQNISLSSSPSSPPSSSYSQAHVSHGYIISSPTSSSSVRDPSAYPLPPSTDLVIGPTNITGMLTRRRAQRLNLVY